MPRRSLSPPSPNSTHASCISPRGSRRSLPTARGASICPSTPWYGRIAAARAARQWPAILDLLAEGSTTLTTVCLLATHLTADNHLSLLEDAKHRTRREVEAQVAALRPLPPVPSTIRKVPASRAVEQQPAVVLAQMPLTVGPETTASAPHARGARCGR